MMDERGLAAQPGSSNEEEFADGLLAFDAGSWRRLFEANYDRVYRYACLRLGSGPDAQDVASNTFAEAARSIGGFRYRGIPVAAWLFRIAHHETVDALRRRQAQPAVLADDHAFEHRELAQAIDRIDLGVGLAQLKAEHREVLLLRFIEDLSIRETAQVLGKTEGAVKVLQLRALRSLRTKVGGDSHDRSARAS